MGVLLQLSYSRKKDFVLGVGADDTWDDVGTKNSASSEIIKLSLRGKFKMQTN